MHDFAGGRMRTRKDYNYKIDWHSAGINHEDKTAPIVDTLKRRQNIIADRKHYFDMLRRFLLEIDAEVIAAQTGCMMIPVEKIEQIFERYDVHFVDVDDIKRVNLDEPND